MSDKKKEIYKIFITQYFNYLTFLKSHDSDNDVVFNTFIKKNNVIKKTNPKLFIKLWYESVYIPYYTYIENKDESYFLNKTYDENIDNIDYMSKKCKEIYQTLGNNEKEILWKFIKILSDLSALYFS